MLLITWVEGAEGLKSRLIRCWIGPCGIRVKYRRPPGHPCHRLDVLSPAPLRAVPRLHSTRAPPSATPEYVAATRALAVDACVVSFIQSVRVNGGETRRAARPGPHGALVAGEVDRVGGLAGTSGQHEDVRWQGTGREQARPRLQ